MRRLVLLAALAAPCACIDFKGAVDAYCAKAGVPGMCGLPLLVDDAGRTIRADGGNGTDLLPEPADAGALLWGHRWGDAGSDEEPTAIARMPSGDVLLGGRRGPAELFITRWSSGGIALETWTATGAGDLGGLAVTDAGVRFVSGTLRGTLTLPGGTFDAGTHASAGFIARYEADAGLSGWLQLESADGGGSSRIGRIELAGELLVAIGAWDSELVVGGASIGERSGEGGFVLVLDGGLGLQSWTLAAPGCNTSTMDDLAIDDTNRAHVYLRLTQNTAAPCWLGPAPGTVLSDPQPWHFTVPTSGTGHTPTAGATSYGVIVDTFAVRGAIARDTFVIGFTAGSEGTGSAQVATGQAGNFSVFAFESQVATIAGGPQRAHAVLAYRGGMESSRLGIFGGPSLPPRPWLSPVIFPVTPGSSTIPWARVLEAEDAPAYPRVSVMTADGSLVIAGSFTAGLGTQTQLLRSSGGSDVFIVKFHPTP